MYCVFIYNIYECNALVNFISFNFIQIQPFIFELKFCSPRCRKQKQNRKIGNYFVRYIENKFIPNRYPIHALQNRTLQSHIISMACIQKESPIDLIFLTKNNTFYKISCGQRNTKSSRNIEIWSKNKV